MDKGVIKITGNGEINEGEYSKIKIMGSARSNGHVVADEIKVMGNANFAGDIEGGECTIHGNAHIEGNVNIIRLKVNGDLRIGGQCNVQELIVNGKVEINGEVQGKNIVVRGRLILNEALKGQTLKAYGGITSSKDVSVEDILVEGRIECDGLLSGERITMHTYDHSKCREIGATTLIVERPIYHFLWLSHKRNILLCDTIEADDMKIENVEAKVARGKNISLSGYCDIHTVEYSGSFSKGGDVAVKELVKVD